jgi:hypothetical protein
VAHVECVLQLVYEHGTSADPVDFHALAVKLLNEPEKRRSPVVELKATPLEHVQPKLKFVGKDLTTPSEAQSWTPSKKAKLIKKAKKRVKRDRTLEAVREHSGGFCMLIRDDPNRRDPRDPRRKFVGSGLSDHERPITPGYVLPLEEGGRT